MHRQGDDREHLKVPFSAGATLCLHLPDLHNCFCQTFLGTKTECPLQPQLEEQPLLNKINRSNPQTLNPIQEPKSDSSWTLPAELRADVLQGGMCRVDGDVLLPRK